MVTKDELLFRQIFTLKDGARVLLRPLAKDDRQALLDFFLPASLVHEQTVDHPVRQAPRSVADVFREHDPQLPALKLKADRVNKRRFEQGLETDELRTDAVRFIADDDRGSSIAADCVPDHRL